MDGESLTKIRDIVSLRIRSIVFERYGKNIPAHLIEGCSQVEDALGTIKEFGLFRADPDLQDLFEVFHKTINGDYGSCLFCRKEIDVPKLKKNPLAKFCDACEKILNLANNAREAEHLLSIY